MNWLDLHIGFELKLAESGDYLNTTFTKHKLDEWLNKGMFSLLDKFFPGSRVNPGYSDNTLISELVQSLESYYEKPFYTFDDRAVRGFYPQDFYRMISVRLNSGAYCSDRTSTTVSDTFNYWVINLKNSITGTPLTEKLAKFRIDCVVEDADDNPVGDCNIYQMIDVLPTGFSDIALYQLIHRLLLQYGGNSEFFLDIYYERFADLYERGCFIIVEKPNSLTTDLEDMTVTYTDTAGLEVVDYVAKQSFSLTREFSSSTARWINDVRFLDSELEGASSNDPYNKTTKKSPYVIMSGGQFLAYHYSSFNLFKYNLKYLRTPKLINHEADQGLDFGVSYGSTRLIGEAIIDEAVKLAAVYTRSELASSIQ